MICELLVKNLALIDKLSLEFRKGFSVFTGETGAGKSILVGAIGLLLGDRAYTETIRSGYEEAEVIGTFELKDIPLSLKSLLKENNIKTEDGIFIIRRIITKAGRNRIYINQIPVPLSTLKIIGSYIVDFHSQHEHQSLLKQETPAVIVNSLPDVKPAWKEYSSCYSRYIKEKDKLDNFLKKADELEKKRDFLEFQYNEISEMELKPNEEESLNKEYQMISSLSERIDCVSSIHSIISGDNQKNSLERKIAEIRKNIEKLAKYDSSTSEWLSDIENSITFFTELDNYTCSYLENASEDANPARVDFINSRLAKIQRLKKKYSLEFNDLLSMQRDLKSQIDSIENINADRSVHEKRLKEAEQICRKVGEKLTIVRKRTTLEFDLSIIKEMKKLGFPDGKWKTVFVPDDKLSAGGMEEIEFKVQTNAGEPLLPLVKTASGGEISRLMLAVKTVLSYHDNIPVLIFDEIDSGIGGLLAKEVGKSLLYLSKNHQVVCISHLHQIASIADNHYKVFKKSENNRTIIKVFELDEKSKVEEISRMLGSDSDISKEHARELLSKSEKSGCSIQI